MLEIMLRVLPLSIVFVAIVFFSLLAMKIFPWEFKRRERSRKFLLNQFVIGLVVFCFSFPIVTSIAIHDGPIQAHFLLQMAPFLIADIGVVMAWKAFERLLPLMPKEQKKVAAPVAESAPSNVAE